MTYSPAIKYLTDVHCHPTDSEIPAQAMEDLPLRVAAMSSRSEDQHLVADMAARWPDKVVPCFGFHPWFTHRISLHNPPPAKLDHYAALFLPGIPAQDAMENVDFANLFKSLPDPIPLSNALTSVRNSFERFPNALLGEVGLDRSFRIPFLPFRAPGTPDDTGVNSDDHKRPLSPFRVPLGHQLVILEAQIDLAIEYQRAISLHSVKAQQASIDLMKRFAERYGNKFYAISLGFHSCGLSAETWGDIQKAHSNVFTSLSVAINARSPAHEALVKACDPARLLVESDHPMITQSAQMTWEMLEIVAKIKGWRVEQSAEDVIREDSEPGAVRRLMVNWEAFLKGGHQPSPPKDSNKVRKRDKFPHAEEDWESNEGDIGTVVY